MTEMLETPGGEPFPPLADVAAAAAPDASSSKLSSRQRFLRGLRRMSSSPSLTNLRRPRSTSCPYHSSSRLPLSCTSLAGVPPQHLRPGTPQPSPLARSDTPDVEFPFHDCLEEQPGVRAVRVIPASTPSTALLPADLRAQAKPVSKPPFPFWDNMPQELRIAIFSHLPPKELVRVSRVSKTFYRFCFDGQLWTTFNASEFYQDIPADSLARIIIFAGPFIKDLNLRGCVQVEHYRRTEAVVKACKNLINATLEGCRNFQKTTLHSLIQSNDKLVHLNLTGLSAVSNSACQIVAESCTQLESFNVSWCQKVDAKGIKTVVDSCKRLKDLRAGEVKGFHNLETAESIFRTNNLERLVLSGCADLTDEALKIMMHGKDPEIDILTNRPVVSPRKLRHLDLSKCKHLTSAGVKAIGYVTPELEGLQLSGCKNLTDEALEPILASTPRLTHLELEDLAHLTNSLLSEHLVKAPCAASLQHLSLSCCGDIGDIGVLPVMQTCTKLRSCELDNTRISDLVLAEAATTVAKRSRRSTQPLPPTVTLSLVVYDCHNVTWAGLREVLFRNTQVKVKSVGVTYPSEVIELKCFYGFQMTVNEHHKRVMRADFAAAARLERKSADYMQATEEAGTVGAGQSRRRRRARQTHALHLDEEDGVIGRRRARTIGSCSVM
ncbi:F-box domain protein [Cordyceps fumosorosea ARSEF 2679]|uniref:F-box domain protein n=1 Tax=Cordyceps fumosorosea (strain ARSEF 2679) TaxID=1081104 RepID=A0A168ES53_CORFA|nr:F-box domain protein [Cordyceps fumosorosea ARSEF 2679]OAA74147.1 F-box domain protein [Cordyceps fumosorosea ARSEF 2679]